MEATSEARIVKIATPFHFVLQSEDNSTIQIQVNASANRHYHHLLPRLAHEPVTYSLAKKSTKFIEEYKKGRIELGGKEIASLYQQADKPKQYLSEIIPNQTLQCFVARVECLKLELIELASLKHLTFYFSEMKLVRIGNVHPKQMWERAHSYFQKQLEGEFVKLTVSGSQNYKEEVNILGEIVRSRDNSNLKAMIVSDGYAELSKHAQKYLNEQTIIKINSMRDKAQKLNRGMWETSKQINKSGTQAMEFKQKQWQEWIKEGRRVNTLRGEEEQCKVVLEELGRVCRTGSRIEYNRLKTVIDVLMVLLEGQLAGKHLKVMEEAVKLVCNLLANLQVGLAQNVDHLDFVKCLNKLLILLSFYHCELEKLAEGNRADKFHRGSEADVDRAMKLIFRLCFLGNQTFHEKLFGKRKQHNYENFNFQSAYLQGGFSSHSECSDYQDAEKMTREERRDRKLALAQQKIRMNATSLLAMFFKHYPKVCETHWEMCVSSNIISPEFLTHVKQLRISGQEVKMTPEQRLQIVSLMRTNFGDHSLMLLSIFERSNKVRINSIACVLNMVGTFEGRKLVAAAERAYVEKLLKSTKSSFVPKSFIIFSGLRNALYFLLFALYHEKNLQVVVLIFKTLCQLCNKCSLMDKMSFEEGIGLLMGRYILPVLEFQWDIAELEELKILCINFLSVLVNNQKRWAQIEETYFKSADQNVNDKLLRVISARKANGAEDKIVAQILNYFTKLSKNYFDVIFRPIQGQQSIWTLLKDIFIERPHPKYAEFVTEIFKGNVDQLQSIGANHEQGGVPSLQQGEIVSFFVLFLSNYVKDTSQGNYCNLLSALTYMDYHSWEKQEAQYCRQFLLHCFGALVGEKHQSQWHYPSLDSIKTASPIRIALIKLAGYMSFCPAFHNAQIMRKAIRVLLEQSKQAKAISSIVKITWGLSNWVKIPLCVTALSQAELKQCLDYLVKHCSSDREKVASNCTRGLGFFLQAAAGKADSEKLRRSILANLSHSVMKVRTNTTKTLLSLSGQLSAKQVKELLGVLEQNMLKNNYHLQMETLKLLRALDNPISTVRMLSLLVSVLKNLLNYTTMEYEFSQINTIRQLRFTILSEIFDRNYPLTEHPDLAKDVLVSVYAYLASDCLEKQHKISSNSRMMERDFDKSEEAQRLIFNPHTVNHDNEEQVIKSQVISKELSFEAAYSDLNLIKRIKEYGQKDGAEEEEWGQLGQLRIEANTVYLDHSALLKSKYHQKMEDLMEEG